MCGIAGIVGLGTGSAPASREALVRMASALYHRGPDEFGVYRDDRAGLAHARLSIIDLSTGQQPMSDEDGSTWIVFNGEIFNYVELREELVARGHRFHTQSGAYFWAEDGYYPSTAISRTFDPKMSRFHSHRPGAELTIELISARDRAPRAAKPWRTR